MQLSQHAFAFDELSQQPLKKGQIQIQIMNFRVSKVCSWFGVEIYLQNINATHAQRFIALHARNTTKFTHFRGAIDAFHGLYI